MFIGLEFRDGDGDDCHYVVVRIVPLSGVELDRVVVKFICAASTATNTMNLARNVLHPRIFLSK